MTAELQTCSWVSVDERLPSTDARVLVVYKPAAGRQRQVYVARHSGGQWRLIDDKTGTRLPERVTDWMPMLRLPRLRGQR